MVNLKQRLDDLLNEKKDRAADHAALIKRHPKKGPSVSLSDLDGLSEMKMIKKLERLPEDEIVQLYKILERKAGFRIDPNNYKIPVIVKNFITLWIRKKKDDQKKAERGEPITSMTDSEISRIMGPGGSMCGLCDYDNEPL